MLSGNIGYTIQPLIEEAPLAHPIKCRLSLNAPPSFIIPKRTSLAFYTISSNGLNPDFTMPFSKDISGLQVIPAKSFQQPGVTDLILVFFSDSTFAAFTDPENIKYIYTPSNPFTYKLTDASIFRPLLLTYIRPGIMRLWDAISSNKNMAYDLIIKSTDLIDFKFIFRQNHTFVCLFARGEHSFESIAYTLDLDTLTANQFASLSVPKIEDSKPVFIVPIPAGTNRPYYSIFGKDSFILVYKDDTKEQPNPFGGTEPTSYCNFASSLFLVGALDGSLCLVEIKNSYQAELIGKLPNTPIHIAHLDGTYFSIQTHFELIFIDIEGFSVLTKIPLQQPLSSLTSLSIPLNTIFAAHCYKESPSLGALGSGSKFIEAYKIPVTNCHSIFSFKSLLVVSLYHSESHVITTEKLPFKITQLHNFHTDTMTYDVFPFENSFYQITPTYMSFIGSEEIIHFESELLCVSHSKQLLLGFTDKAIIFDGDFHEFQIRSEPIYCAIQNQLTAFFSPATGIDVYSNTQLIKSIDSGMLSALFFSSKLLAFRTDGLVQAFSLEDFSVSSKQCGYFINSVQPFHENYLLSGSHSILVTPALSSECVFVPTFRSGCSLDLGLALLSGGDILIGEISDSSQCKISQHPIDIQPYLISLHEKPTAIFCATQVSENVSVKAYSVPGYSLVFDLDLGLAQVNCFLYLPDHKMTLFGAMSDKESKIYAVRKLLKKFQVIGEYQINEGVFTLSRGIGGVLVGARGKLLLLDVRVTPNGFCEIEELKSCPSPVIPRNIQACDDFVVHFDVTRSITFYKPSLEFWFNSFAQKPLHMGIIGPQLTKRKWHIITIDEDGVLCVSLLSIADLTLQQTSHIKLTSPAFGLFEYKSGVYVISQKDGGFKLMAKEKMENIKNLRKLQVEIEKEISVKSEESKIVDVNVLEFFSLFETKKQIEIAQKVGVDRFELVSIIDTILRRKSTLVAVDSD